MSVSTQGSKLTSEAFWPTTHEQLVELESVTRAI